MDFLGPYILIETPENINKKPSENETTICSCFATFLTPLVNHGAGMEVCNL